MPDFELSLHAKYMLKERGIPEEWVWRTIESADKSELDTEDNNWHYTKAIVEKENRVLRVVVNQGVNPYRIVTVFFDRRLRKTK